MNPNTKNVLFNIYGRKYVVSVFFLLLISTALIITNAPFVTMAVQYPRELYWAIGWHIEQTPPPCTIEKFFSSVHTGIQKFKKSKRIDSSKKMNEYDCFTCISVISYGYIQRVLGKQVCGDVIKLNNGYLTTSEEATVNEPISEITNIMNHIDNLGKVTRSLNTPLLYISFPHKIHKHDSQLPFPSNDINTLTDCFCKQFEDKISRNNIQLYDARNLYAENSKEHYRLFFRSDSHWQPEYAFYVFLDILKYFDKNIFNIPEEVSNSQNYEFTSFPFTLESRDGIGSYERRTGQLYFTNNDIVCFPIPKYPVRFEISVPSENYNKKCSFTESICLLNQPLRTIINPDQSQGKILLLKDSFALPFWGYLGLISHQVDMIDLRLYHGSIYEYIKNNRPDMVIIAYNPHMLFQKHSIMFEFDKRCKDSQTYTTP